MSRGRIEVITGCMFSGKSEELVSRLRRAVIARRGVIAFKHASDNRYHRTDIGCHAGATFKATAAMGVTALKRNTLGYDVIGIDEAQFFSEELVAFCDAAANAGQTVIVAGLDMDSSGLPFGPIANLMSIAERVDKLTAICMVCGEPASRSYHKAGKVEQIEVGADQYEARCRGCWLLSVE